VCVVEEGLSEWRTSLTLLMIPDILKKFLCVLCVLSVNVQVLVLKIDAEGCILGASTKSYIFEAEEE